MKMQNNILRRTRCYLPGAMEYSTNGKEWRSVVKSSLENRDITFFDPYYKPFVNDVPEDDHSRSEMLHWMETEQYDLVAQRMKRVRGYDLRMVDLSDWFLCVISPRIASWGTAEEIFLIVRQKKPLFLVIDDPRGKKACPLWLLGVLPHKYIYNTLGEAIEVIKAIDSGVVKMSSDRWKLLRYDLR
jgi:hypothetical protein